MFLRLAVFASALVLAAPSVGEAQIFIMQGARPGNRPKAEPIASPRDTTFATVGTTHITVDYGRPSKKGRVIFGGLVPYDSVWRTGANEATTIITSKDLKIGGALVPAGRHTLYTLPSKKGWQLIINNSIGQWGTKYSQAEDLARVPMTLSKLPMVQEKFWIAIDNGKLMLRWDTTEASVPIEEVEASQ